MPPTQVDKRIQKILTFAAHVQRVLTERSGAPSRQELDANIKLLPTVNAGSHSKELDRIGADLWNVANGIIAEDEDPEKVRIGVRVRIFALLLLNASLRASQRRSKDPGEQIRILKIATRGARLCLDKNELNLAFVALETCSQYAPVQRGAPPLMQISSVDRNALDERDQIFHSLADELTLLRLYHAWKSDRLDLAEHFLSKIDLAATDAAIVVKGADLFFEISKSLPQPGKRKDVLIWSDRAFRALVGVGSEALTPEAAELLLSIGITLIDDLILIGTDDCRRRAHEICDLLENTQCLGNRIAVLVAKAKLLITEQRVDTKLLSSTLLQIIKMAILTEDTFKMIMQTLQKSAKASHQSALPALKAFICQRLLPELQRADNTPDHLCEWLEKATITYTHLVTMCVTEKISETLDDFEDLLHRVNTSRHPTFSTKATHAAQTLIWKASGETNRALSYRWCAIMRHPVYQNAGSLNKARISRKLMRLAMDDGDFPTARETFFQMPAAAQNEPLSRYMVFKLALETNDEELATTSLGAVIKATPKDPTYVYACVLASQQSAMRHMAVVALQSILDQRLQGTHLPSLLRCTARLLIAELKDTDQENSNLAEVVRVCETAAKCIDDLRQSGQWRAEVQWWSKNIYNLSIRMCGKTDPEYLIRLLDVCAQFLDAYPNDVGLMQQDDVLHRQMICGFLATTALVVMGRGAQPAGAELEVQCYLHAQQRIQTFRTLHNRIKDTENADQETWSSRAFAMLKFDVECILKLKQWEALDQALRACLNTPGVGRWDALADLLIIAHRELDHPKENSHADMMTQLLQRIINDSWKREKEIAKVARWLRSTLTLCSGHAQGDFSLKLLQQAANMAESGSRRKQDRYPESELQWLAATGFNHAVDLLGAGQKSYLSWMDAALDIARWSEDNGALHEILTAKRTLAVARQEELIK